MAGSDIRNEYQLVFLRPHHQLALAVRGRVSQDTSVTFDGAISEMTECHISEISGDGFLNCDGLLFNGTLCSFGGVELVEPAFREVLSFLPRACLRGDFGLFSGSPVVH